MSHGNIFPTSVLAGSIVFQSDRLYINTMCVIRSMLDTIYLFQSFPDDSREYSQSSVICGNIDPSKFVLSVNFTTWGASAVDQTETIFI